ncbi:DUF2304 domain-containing protein [Olsenella sp. YH-ols2217]|uniref:DUF2304 domain-containing protein n=1 Tax=Kribbibacterium absianum TaxID=3044210 RepID=A0ABT6ZMY2_9ACTN|nr:MULTISPECIES: DUF2304 domain-containing protein [unclassified Olsenella]MDJ1122156.1 DUF2304 domain-containing protein [Olsenella sp. YH-ols2216]MDJ1130164.1 DUF2304 domain-containing protein [Olsenella sp. YH-ols2217]
MSLPQRIVLFLGAVFILALICSAVKKRRIQIEDSLFWVFFAALLVVIGAFPQIAYFFSHLLGFISPSNFVFAAVIAVLLVREFRNSSKISVLRYRLDQLAEEVALDKNEDGRGRDHDQ